MCWGSLTLPVTSARSSERYRDPAAGGARLRGPGLRLGRLLRGFQRADPGRWTPPPCSTAGARCSAAPPCTGRVSCRGTRPASDGGSVPATRPRTRSEWSTPPRAKSPPAWSGCGGCSSRTGTPGTSSSLSPAKVAQGWPPKGPTWPQWFCDDHLWLVIATCAYLKETGDYGYLERRVPYAQEERSAHRRAGQAARAGPPGVDDTIWGHMIGCRGLHPCQSRPARSAEVRLLRLGRHLERRPRLGLGRERLVCDAVLPGGAGPGGAGGPSGTPGGGGALRRHCTTRWRDAVNACAWDGSWYARCFDDDGRLVGVSSEARHRINLIPQSWCVIGEVAPPERAELAMASAHDILGHAVWAEP